MAHLLSERPASAYIGQKEGDGDDEQAGSTLCADRVLPGKRGDRSTARSTRIRPKWGGGAVSGDTQ